MSETLRDESPAKLDALTGIRIIAALWVVLFHIRGNLATEFEAYRYVAPVVDYGELGVELFFVLSGFVLALAYGRRLSRAWQWSSTLNFWWARFIRLWPAYATVLVVVSAWHAALSISHISDPVAPRDFSLGSFVRQLLMIVQWNEPDSDRLTWNGPAWTVSAEVLAYLVFPLFTLVVLRWVDHIPTYALPVLATATTVPLILSTIVRGSLYEPWTWVLRIGCCFVAGYVMFFFYERLRNQQAAQRAARWAFPLVTLLFLAILVAAHRAGVHVWGFTAIALLPTIIVTLALDRGPSSRIFSARPFVIGGTVSYSVYLVHMPIIEPFWLLQGTVAWLAPGTTGAKIGFLLLPVLVVLTGYALWRFVEEPARKALRSRPSFHRSALPHP